MKFSESYTTSHRQWAAYKQLELIPVPTANPANRGNHLASGLNLLWRPLLNLLMDELVVEQQVEYLDRCWSLNELSQGGQVSTHSLQRFWMLIK